jgi:hypothetical protein
MNFYIPEIMSLVLAPRHELSCSWFVWRRLMANLRERGKYGRRESGAFLLGRRWRGRVRICDYVLYDDLDPHCLDSGIVHFDGRYFGELWQQCESRGLACVADVHTHPCGVRQSDSDKAHPMIARSGHLALIIPEFAAPPVRRRDVGIYQYQGGRAWVTIAPARRKRFLHTGF